MRAEDSTVACAGSRDFHVLGELRLDLDAYVDGCRQCGPWCDEGALLDDKAVALAMVKTSADDMLQHTRPDEGKVSKCWLPHPILRKNTREARGLIFMSG